MKKRNSSMVGMIAVLIIVILLFTTVGEAGSRPFNQPGQVPSAESAASSTPSAPASGEPTNKRWLIVNGETKTVYDTQAEATSASNSCTPNKCLPIKEVFETPIGDVESGAAFPSNPSYTMDQATGRFIYEGKILEPAPDGLGNYEITQGNNVVARGIKIQLRNADGTPATGANAYAIQEEDVAQHTVTFRTGSTATQPMSLDMYNELFVSKGEMIKSITKVNGDSSSITTVSGATFTIKETSVPSTPPSSDISLTTVTETRNAPPSSSSSPVEHKEYSFKTTGIRGEVVDGNVVLNLQDGTKVYTGKDSGEFEKGIANGGLDAKVQGRAYDYTLKHDANGKVTMERKLDTEVNQEQSAESITLEAGGVKTETRYTKKNGNVVDFEGSVKTDASGRVLERTERTSEGFSDIGRVDFGFFKLGGYEGDRLKRTVYGAGGKTYTQMSNKFTLDPKTGYISKGGANGNPKKFEDFEANNLLINYDPDTGEVKTYPPNFNVNDPRLDRESPQYDAKFDKKSGEFKTKVGTKFGFGGLFGVIPDELEKYFKNGGSSLSDEQKEAIRAEYKEGASKDRSARFSTAQEYAQTFGQLSSLFADNGAFKAWNRRTDMLFNNWVLGGSEYRVSKICESNLRKIGDNVLIVQTPGGQLVTAAFVNGERQLFEFPNGTKQFLYKISYKVNIPESLIDKAELQRRQRIRAIDDPEPVAPARILRKDPGSGQRLEEFLAEGPFFNVFLSGNSPKKCLFIDSGTQKCEGESVKKGANALQRNMFVKYSTNDYNRVCIEFTRSLEFANKKANSICADIIGVDEQPRNVVDVPEVPTVNPSLGSDDAGSGTAAAPVTETRTGQIVEADI